MPYPSPYERREARRYTILAVISLAVIATVAATVIYLLWVMSTTGGG